MRTNKAKVIPTKMNPTIKTPKSAGLPVCTLRIKTFSARIGPRNGKLKFI